MVGSEDCNSFVSLRKKMKNNYTITLLRHVFVATDGIFFIR